MHMGVNVWDGVDMNSLSKFDNAFQYFRPTYCFLTNSLGQEWACGFASGQYELTEVACFGVASLPVAHSHLQSVKIALLPRYSFHAQIPRL